MKGGTYIMNVSIKKILSLLLVVAMAFTTVDTSGLFKLTENVYAGDQNAPVNLTFSKSGNSKTITWKDRKSTRLNSSHLEQSRMPSSA